MHPSARIISLLRFLRDAFGDFRRNRGFLLAGAVAYNALLSLIALLTVLLVVLSQIFETHALGPTLIKEMELMVPGYATLISDQVDSMLANRELVGWLGGFVLLFFSSIAFRSLEDAFGVIFSRAEGRRNFWLSAVIPYVFVFLVTVGLLLITAIATALEALPRGAFSVLGRQVILPDVSGVLIYAVGFIGLVALFSAIYRFMPSAHVAWSRAMAGGVTATVLWELTRYLLVWYYTNVSLVNVVYGSIATVVIALLILEVASIIVLFGAQVIANLDDAVSPTC